MKKSTPLALSGTDTPVCALTSFTQPQAIAISHEPAIQIAALAPPSARAHQKKWDTVPPLFARIPLKTKQSDTKQVGHFCWKPCASTGGSVGPFRPTKSTLHGPGFSPGVGSARTCDPARHQKFASWKPALRAQSCAKEVSHHAKFVHTHLQQNKRSVYQRSVTQFRPPAAPQPQLSTRRTRANVTPLYLTRW